MYIYVRMSRKVIHVMFLFLSTVSPLGTVDVTPNNIIAVDHMTDSVTFTCQSMAGLNLNYTWLVNGSSKALNNSDIVVNDSQLIVNNVTYLLGGRYTCVVTTSAGNGRDSSDLFGELVCII